MAFDDAEIKFLPLWVLSGKLSLSSVFLKLFSQVQQNFLSSRILIASRVTWKKIAEEKTRPSFYGCERNLQSYPFLSISSASSVCSLTYWASRAETRVLCRSESRKMSFKPFCSAPAPCCGQQGPRKCLHFDYERFSSLNFISFLRFAFG
jgi:hypothetical protein